MQENIKALSERLKYLAKNSNSYSAHNDPKIKSENLKYNLSLIISKIILSLNFIDRSKENFIGCINEFNKSNNTKLSFEDFENICWIRTVCDEINIPEVVQRFLFQVYRDDNGELEIPEEKIEITKCLLTYYKKYFEYSRLTISKETLNELITDFRNEELSISFFIEKKIIGFDTSKDLYYWKDNNDYTRHLRNEIASTLWLSIGSEEATETEFKYFFKLIQGTQIWIDDLKTYLSVKNCLKIKDLAASFLKNEIDLLQSKNDFIKIWLDNPSYSHINIKSKIPLLNFNYNSSIEYIEDIEKNKTRFQGVFDYQKNRSYCLGLLRIIVANDNIDNNHYQLVISILKDISRPHLVWTLYNDIISEFQEVIPYLITDYALIPLAFKKLDKIDVNETLLSEQINRDKIQEESFELINKLYLEMFDIVLEDLSLKNSEFENSAQTIGRILLDNANKVFSHGSNYNQDIDHSFYRKRYDELLKKVYSKRISNHHSFYRNNLNPRFVFYILVELVEFLKKQEQKINVHYNEYLNISSGFLDLSIEVLKLTNLQPIEDELEQVEKQKIEKAKNDLIELLEKHITAFYTTTEIEVQTYDEKTSEKKQIKRGVNEFGFEIIDWGYLYLHFKKNGVLKKFNENFINSLNFKTDGDKYNDQNIEQFEKIKLYLKSLMIANISINSNKILLEIEELSAAEVLNETQVLIKEMAIKYSYDDLINERINVFTERFNIYGFNKYYQTLISLLYQNINIFEQEDLDKFIDAFFEESIDIGGMLSAINILENKHLQENIASKIKNIQLDKFIESSHTITELENALIEAINSENHWELAKPLLERIQKHLTRVKQNNDNTNNFLFEINLLLAFKEKKINRLKELVVPINEYRYPKENPKGENDKQFFIALHKLYNEKKSDEAITILKSLLSKNNKNVKYAFHLFRAQTLKALEKNE